MPDWKPYRKALLTEMLQVHSPSDLPAHPDVWPSPNGEGFDVNTSEGIALNAPWGAWLAKDNKGGLYPIAADVQAASYEPAATVIPMPDGTRSPVRSQCCSTPLQPLATGRATHEQFGNGISVVVACGKCDQAYGRPTHVFSDGQGVVATIIPD